MANNPYVNKVQFGNQTLIDLTSDTVTADKLMQGYTAHDRTGALITGTATGGGSGGNVWQDAQGYVHLDDEGTTPITVEPLSVTQNGTYTATTGHAYSPVTVNVSGGGGLEYETGTWTPSEDVTLYWILFSNEHTEPPFFYMIADATGTYTDVSSTGCVTFFADWHHFTGVPIYESQSSLRYSEYRTRYKSSADNLGGGGSALGFPYTDSGSSSAVYPGYFISTTGIRAYASSTSRYFRAGRTYKWIAAWVPTT